MNKNVFSTGRVSASAPNVSNPPVQAGRVSTPASVPPTTDVNHAGGKAYRMTPRQALAQVAVTGTFNQTHYVSAEEELAVVENTIKDLITAGEAEYVACVAVYAHRHGKMKDMPVVICAYLAVFEPRLFACAAPVICNNAKQVRNLVQVFRTGRIEGRKSIPRCVRRFVTHWFNTAPVSVVLNGMIGNAPSLQDVVAMIHPKPANPERAGLLQYVAQGGGANFTVKAKKPGQEVVVPDLVRHLQTALRGETITPEVRGLDFRFFNAAYANERPVMWSLLAGSMGWHALRMNLNTMVRDGVFENREVADVVIQRLCDEKLIQKTRMMPYQVFTTLMNFKGEGAGEYHGDRVVEALERAVMYAINRPVGEGGVPEIGCSLCVAVDNSGSMSAPVTGYRQGATTSVSCAQAAAVLASSLLVKNKSARAMAFDTSAREVTLPRDSKNAVMDMVRLLDTSGGGTAISSPILRLLAEKDAELPDLVVIVSDNESWADQRIAYGGNGTSLMQAWDQYRKRNPNAKLVCVDITPNVTPQTMNGHNGVYRFGGFSDAVFAFVGAVADGTATPSSWEDAILAMKPLLYGPRVEAGGDDGVPE